MTALIAFDLDGTLEDSRTDMANAIVRLRKKLGLAALPAAGFREHVNRGMEHLYRECFADYGGGDIAQRYADEYGAGIAEETKLYPGVKDAVHAVAELGALACVTNKPEALSVRLLDALGIGSLFQAVIGGDTCAHAKPHPVMLEAAAEKTGAERVVMVGDTPGDIKLARSYGAKVIWCAWGYKDEPGDVEPDARANRADELPALAKRLLALVGTQS